MAAFTPDRLQAFVLATVAVAFFGATQDIAVDAYRIEIAPESAQGALVATYSLGYRIGLIVAGAFAAIMADHIAWPRGLRDDGRVHGDSRPANLMAREPDVVPVKTQGWAHAMQVAVVDPFADFFRRYGVALALA